MRLDPQGASILNRAQWHLPYQLLGIQVDRAHAAKRWGIAWHAQRRLENVDLHAAIDTCNLRANGAHETRHFIGRDFVLAGVFLGYQRHA
ncbi:hypothetical protein D3C80_1566260 [compost metagenome]